MKRGIRKLMTYTKKLFFLLSLLFVMLAFQNCGMQLPLNPTQFLAQNKQSGNGGGYEGKPDGTYYHYVPSYTCEGHPAAEKFTEIKDGQVFLYQNKNNQCADESAPLAVDTLSLSPFQQEFISVNDSLFKRYDEKPEGIPTNLAEVLCLDNFDNPSFEIVSHFDREKNQALTRVYFPNQRIDDFSISRVLSYNEVRYVASNLSYRVDLSKPAFAERKFAGRIDKTTITGLAAQPLVCVIGGSIDTSNWKLKPLTNVDVGSFELLKNNEIMFFSEVSRTYWPGNYYTYVSHLFKIGLDEVVSDFSKAILGEKYNVKYRIGPVDDNLSLFSALTTSEMWPSLFVYDSRTGRTRKLTNLVAGAKPEAYFLETPVLTKDQHLFFDTQIIEANADRSGAIRVYDFNTDKVDELVAANELPAYRALKKSNKLLLFWQIKNGRANVIEIYDAKTKQSAELLTATPAGCSLRGYQAESSSDETAIFADELCGTQVNIVQVSLKSGQVKVLANDARITWMSADHNRLITTSSGKVSLLYDFKAAKSLAIPVDPRMGYDGSKSGATDFMNSGQDAKIGLSGDRWLYGFGGGAAAPTMYRIDVNSGAATPVCESAIGKKMFVGVLPNQKVFLFTYDASVKVYRFYEAKSATDCARINEFPSDIPNVPSLIPTNIGFGLLLGLPLSRDSSDHTPEAVFVPIDGRPPLKFNPLSTGNWGMAVSADKNRIVLEGPDVDNVQKIFSFDLN